MNIKQKLFGFARSRGASLKVAILASSVLVVQAQAALPAWATSMITEASDNVTSVLTAIGPVIAISVGGFLVIKLIKRGAAKI